MSLKHAAGALLQMGVKEVVVIHFPEGSFARTRKGKITGNPHWICREIYRGNGGSGDAFCAGMLYGLHEEWPLDKCLMTGFVLRLHRSLIRPAPEDAAIGQLPCSSEEYRPRPKLSARIRIFQIGDLESPGDIARVFYLLIPGSASMRACFNMLL